MMIFTVWNSITITQLGRHAPTKHRRVKSVRLHAWKTSEIGQARETSDKFKLSNNWSQYKRFKNKTSKLIGDVKRKQCTHSVGSLKDTRMLWNHLRTITDFSASYNKRGSG